MAAAEGATACGEGQPWTAKAAPGTPSLRAPLTTQPRSLAKAALHSCLMTLKLMRRREVTPSLADQVPRHSITLGAWPSCPPGRRARAGSRGPRPPSCRVRYPGARSPGGAAPGAVRANLSAPRPSDHLQAQTPAETWASPPPPRTRRNDRAGSARPAPATPASGRPARGERRASCACADRAPRPRAAGGLPPRLPPGRPLLTWGPAW